MNEEESKISKIIPLRKATNEELIEVITDLHTQNYLKEMEIVRLNNIINKIIVWLEDYDYRCTDDLYAEACIEAKEELTRLKEIQNGK